MYILLLQCAQHISFCLYCKEHIMRSKKNNNQKERESYYIENKSLFYYGFDYKDELESYIVYFIINWALLKYI